MSLWDEIQQEKKMLEYQNNEWNKLLRDNVVEKSVEILTITIKENLKQEKIKEYYYIESLFGSKKVFQRHIKFLFSVNFWETDTRDFSYDVSRDIDYKNCWHIYNITDVEKKAIVNSIIKYLKENNCLYYTYKHTTGITVPQTTYNIYNDFPIITMEDKASTTFNYKKERSCINFTKEKFVMSFILFI